MASHFTVFTDQSSDRIAAKLEQWQQGKIIKWQVVNSGVMFVCFVEYELRERPGLAFNKVHEGSVIDDTVAA